MAFNPEDFKIVRDTKGKTKGFNPEDFRIPTPPIDQREDDEIRVLDFLDQVGGGRKYSTNEQTDSESKKVALQQLREVTENPNEKNAAVEAFKETKDSPMLKIPKFEDRSVDGNTLKVGKALVNAFSNTAESFTTPQNLAIAAALPGAKAYPALTKLVSLGFGLDMAAHSVREAVSTADDPSLSFQQRVEKGIGSAITAGLSFLALKHSAGDEKEELQTRIKNEAELAKIAPTDVLRNLLNNEDFKKHYKGPGTEIKAELERRETTENPVQKIAESVIPENLIPETTKVHEHTQIDERKPEELPSGQNLPQRTTEGEGNSRPAETNANRDESSQQQNNSDPQVSSPTGDEGSAHGPQGEPASGVQSLPHETVAEPSKTPETDKVVIPTNPETFGTSHEKTGELRDSRGLPSKETILGSKEAEFVAEAKKHLTENPTAGLNLVRDVLANPRGISRNETFLLGQHLVGLESRIRTLEKTVREAKTPEEREKFSGQISEALHSQREAIEAVEQSGSIQGQDFVARQHLTDILGDSLGRKKRDAKLVLGDKYSPEIDKSIEETHNKIVSLQEQVDKLLETQKAIDLSRAIERLKEPESPPIGRRTSRSNKVVQFLNDRATEARERLKKSAGSLNVGLSPDLIDHVIIGASHIANGLADFVDWSKEIVKEFGETSPENLKEGFDKSKAYYDQEIPKQIKEQDRNGIIENLKKNGLNVADLGKLAREHITNGVDKVEPLLKALSDDLGGHDPKEISKTLSGWDKERHSESSPTQQKLTELNKQQRLLLDIDLLEKEGKVLDKNGSKREPTSEEIVDLQKRKQELLQEKGIVKSPEEIKQERLLRDGLAREVALKEKIAKGEVKEEEKIPKEVSKDLQDTRDRISVLNKQWRKMLGMTEKASEAQKEADRLVNVEESKTEQRDKLQEKVNTGDLSKEPSSTPKPSNEAIDGLNKEIEALQKTLREARKIENTPSKTLERIEKQIEKAKETLAKNQEKLKVGDTSVRETNPKPSNPELDDLRKQNLEVQKKLQELRGKSFEKVKANIGKELEKLQKSNSQDFKPKVKKTNEVLFVENPEIQKLRAQISEQKNIESERQFQYEQALKPKWVRVFDQVAGAAHFSALSGYHVLGKLAGFTFWRLGDLVLSESAQRAWRSIPGFEEYAKGADTEIGLNKGSLEALGSGLARSPKLMLEQFKKGTNSDRLQYGTHRLGENSWYRWFGKNLHASEKTFLLTGAFDLEANKLAEKALKSGQDISDPIVIGAIKADAYMRAQASILQNQNAFATWLVEGQRRLEAANSENGKYSTSKLVLSNAIKVFLTKDITKVPANYVMQSFDAVTGIPRALKMYYQGVENLTPAQRTAMFHLLGVGSIGAASFIWGAMDAFNQSNKATFGGYYQPGMKRDKEDVRFGGMRLGGVELPRILLHAPVLLEPAQMGNTLMRVALSKVSKKDRTNRGIMTGIVASILGLIEQAPVAGQVRPIATLNDSHKVNKTIGEYIAGIIPALVSEIASDTDSSKMVRPTKDIQSAVKKRIPILRETVPVSKIPR